MRILVVEDEEAIRETIRLGLEHHVGFKVETASGAESLDVARAAACDLVIMDMHLGSDRDGLDLIEESAAVNPHVRFLVISGRREVELAARVGSANRTNRVIDTLMKPFELEQLFIAVNRALETAPESPPEP